MKTIVSTTPVKVEADSRTFKQAASLKRFGFNSVVVEGERSQLNLADLPFDLRRMSTNLNETDENSSKDFSGKTSCAILPKIKAIVKKIYLRLPVCLREGVEFLSFIRYYFKQSFLFPIRSIPRASLYYMHSSVPFPAVYFLSKRYKVPFIYDAHDFYSGIERSHGRSRFERRWIDPFYNMVERLCMARASAVVTTSDGIGRLQRQTFGVRPVIIRNCEDFRLEKLPRLDLRQKIGVSWNDFLLVTIGQAKKGMALQECFEALAALPPRVHLALVGKNYEEYLGDLQLSELKNRVHLVQPVKPFEVTPFVKSADASLILYYPRSVNYENFLPNGLFQSIAAELPILYPNLSEIKNIAESYKLGISINPRLPNSISEAVMMLMDNPDLRAMYRQNARRAMQDLNWEKEEAILRELVFEVLGSEPSRRLSDETLNRV